MFSPALLKILYRPLPQSILKTNTAVTSAQTFANNAKFHSHVCSSIARSEEFLQELVYTDVPATWATKIISHLDSTEKAQYRKNYNSLTKTLTIRLGSDPIHNIYLKWFYDQVFNWLVSGVISFGESRSLWAGVGTTFNTFHGAYSSSSKQPDFFCGLGNDRMPRIVAESGWSESWPRLQDDVNLWLVGGGVAAVFLFKWQRVGQWRQVHGVAEMYGLNVHGMPVLKQREVIFPVDRGRSAEAQGLPENLLASGDRARFNLPRKILLGPECQNPRGTLPLEIDELRKLVAHALGFMGLVPGEEDVIRA